MLKAAVFLQLFPILTLMLQVSCSFDTPTPIGNSSIVCVCVCVLVLKRPSGPILYWSRLICVIYSLVLARKRVADKACHRSTATTRGVCVCFRVYACVRQTIALGQTWLQMLRLCSNCRTGKQMAGNFMSPLGSSGVCDTHTLTGTQTKILILQP